MKNYSDAAKMYYDVFAKSHTIDEWFKNILPLNPDMSVVYCSKIFNPMIIIYNKIANKSYDFLYKNDYLHQFYDFSFEFDFKDSKNNIFGINIENKICRKDTFDPSIDKTNIIDEEIEFKRRMKIANLDEKYYYNMSVEEQIRKTIIELYDTFNTYHINKVTFNPKDFKTNFYKEYTKRVNFDSEVYPLSILLKSSDNSIQLKYIKPKTIIK